MTSRLAYLIWLILFIVSNSQNYENILEPYKVEGVEKDLFHGSLEVWENREAGEGRKIPIHVIFIPAKNKSTNRPLFSLSGGPGSTGSGFLDNYLNRYSKLNEDRDIVLIDQRGTGESNPLRCKFLETEVDLQAFLIEMYPEEIIKACYDSLSKKADLSQYTTINIADDINEIREWLGYDKIDLIGFSYGTRLAQIYLKRHEKSIGSVIMWGPTTTYMKLPLHHASDSQRALDLLFEDCLNDPNCSRAFPEIKGEFYDLVNRFRNEDIQADFKHPQIDSTVTLTLHEYDFTESIRRISYSTHGQRQIPYLVHEAFKGNYQPFLENIYPTDLERESTFSDGLYLSVTCTEDVPFIDPYVAYKLNLNTYLGSYRVDQQVRACDCWDRGEIPEDFHEPVKSEKPVLIFSGYLDPVTPPLLGDQIVKHMPNGKNIVLRQMSHSSYGINNFEKLVEVMVEFLNEMSVDNLKLKKLDELEPVEFKIND